MSGPEPSSWEKMFKSLPWPSCTVIFRLKLQLRGCIAACAVLQGATQVVPNIGVGVKEEKARNLVIKQGATVEELVRSLSGDRGHAAKRNRDSTEH